MESQEIRKKFLAFFERRGHVVVPSSSLIPDDLSVLLTTAGMQQFKPYFLGKADPMKDFGTRRTASIQKAFRTSDIDEVGDESHLTFFEMLGHFSFGDYFKKETIEWTYELLTGVFGIKPDRISATVFAGDEAIPFDQESYNAWLQFLPEQKIRKGPRADNVWGPAGPEGPCGAANEVYVDDLEVATLVFMEYFCAQDKSLTPLPQKGVDVGWGFERLVKVLQNAPNIFETDLFAPLFESFNMLPLSVSVVQQRVIIDHARGSSFLIVDGVRPSNKEAGYVLRRLMRRIFTYESICKLPPHLLNGIIHNIVNIYREFYPEILKEQDITLVEFRKERDVFTRAFKRGLDELKKRYPGPQTQEVVRGKPFNPFVAGQRVGREAADLHQTYGLPAEIIREHLKYNFYEFDENEFNEAVEKAFKKHQEISRAGQERKFGGHGLLLDTGELKASDERELKIVTRLHTATHLLNAALRKVLGPAIEQQGSDITVERTRFDFTFPRKLTAEEIKKVEDWVNEVIRHDAKMEFQEMSYEEAVKTGALRFFREKYPARVKVYTVSDPKTGEVFSKELCGGPHVTHTGEIGYFKIIKEESSSAGVRRIRATAE